MTGVTCDFGHCVALELEPHELGLRYGLCEPLEELGETIDLIVVLASREERDLALEGGEPRRIGWDCDPPGFDQV